MLLIASALKEELEAALNLCSHRQKIHVGRIPVWAACRGSATLRLLKLGVGPARAASTLEHALAGLKVTELLVIGYAGALDPRLELAQLVMVERAGLLSEESRGAPLEEIGLSGSWPLANAGKHLRLAESAGLPARCGTALTSFCVIGAPEHKRLLFEKHRASIVDMETAALARSASAAGIPVSCVRAISDAVNDEFLAPLSYDPEARPLLRAARVLAAGNWPGRYRQWREQSRGARLSLRRFMNVYLENCWQAHYL